MIKKGRGQSIEYLVKWKGWVPEWNQWMALRNLGNAQEIVDDYNKEMVEGYREMAMPGRDVAPITQPATRTAPTTTTATHLSSSATQPHLPRPRRRGRPSKGKS